MQTIPLEVFEKNWRIIDQMADEELELLINDMGEEQPTMLTYLLNVGEDSFNQDERETLFFLGVVIWKTMRDYGIVPLVTETVIDSVENLNMEMLSYLEGEPEENFMSTVSMIMESYSQSEMLVFVATMLVDEAKENPGLRSDNLGIIMTYLKITIDCFNI